MQTFADVAKWRYKGFVPDMQRRQLMNFLVVAVTAVPALVLLGGYAYYFLPDLGDDTGGGVVAGDIDGNPVTVGDWLKGHKDNDRDLVQASQEKPTG